MSTRRKVGILAICCLSVLMTNMDLTIVNLAIPSIRTELGATAAHAQWTIAIYALGDTGSDVRTAIDTLATAFYRCGDDLSNE